MIDFILDSKLIELNKEFGFNKFIKVKIIKASKLEDFKKKVAKEKELIVVEANEKILRNVFENKDIDIIIGLEKLEDKDSLHHRNSGLNQVLCNLAKKNKISVGFNFNDVLNSKEQGKLIGRMMQNAKLCKKYKVNVVLGSFAKDKYDLRLRKDLEVFGRLIGIDKLGNTKVFKLKEFLDIKVI
jgi:RNase P/RNase MRP subunit p30|tara:strand:- start:123 stop:674 length:552 start_codon:yes stop_codon:yes gene_type:complete